MKFAHQDLAAGAGLLVVAASLAVAQVRYDDPVVFQRAHLDKATGERTLDAKLWVMEADGSGLRQLTFDATYDDHPSFYADQEHVLFAVGERRANDGRSATVGDRNANAHLVRLNIYSGRRETIAAIEGCALHHPSLSPIDDLLAYQRDCGPRRAQWMGLGPDAYEVPLRATNGVRTPTSLIAMHEKNTDVSPREVALVSISGQGAGSVVQFLTDDTVLHRRPAISPDGRRVAWQTNVEGQGDEIYLAHIDGSEARNLTQAAGNDGHPWLSRDGSFIVFESDRTGSWEIWRLELATGAQRQLTFGGPQYASTRPRM